MRTLLVGASGQLGSAVKDALTWHGHGVMMELFTPSHETLDITNADAVGECVLASQPTVIINCAAWTDVDGAEIYTTRAYAINSDGAWNLASAAAAVGAWMIHVSTEYSDGPPSYVSGVYALSKLMGERRIVEPLPKSHTILRVSCLLSTHPNGWLANVISKASAGKLVGVSAQVTYPTTVDTAAKAIIELARKPMCGPFAVADYPAVSRHALACEALDAARIFRDPGAPQVIELSPSDTQRALRRVDSRLTGPFYGERSDWRPWLKQNAPLIAERERAAAST